LVRLGRRENVDASTQRRRDGVTVASLRLCVFAIKQPASGWTVAGVQAANFAKVGLHAIYLFGFSLTGDLGQGRSKVLVLCKIINGACFVTEKVGEWYSLKVTVLRRDGYVMVTKPTAAERRRLTAFGAD